MNHGQWLGEPLVVRLYSILLAAISWSKSTASQRFQLWSETWMAAHWGWKQIIQTARTECINWNCDICHLSSRSIKSDTRIKTAMRTFASITLWILHSYTNTVDFKLRYFNNGHSWRQYIQRKPHLLLQVDRLFQWDPLWDTFWSLKVLRGQIPQLWRLGGKWNKTCKKRFL